MDHEGGEHSRGQSREDDGAAVVALGTADVIGASRTGDEVA
jgi:hypothetical protein